MPTGNKEPRNKFENKTQTIIKDFVDAANRKDSKRARKELFKIYTLIMDMLPDESKHDLISEIRHQIECDPLNLRKTDGPEMDKLLPEIVWVNFLFDLVLVIDKEEGREEINMESLKNEYVEIEKIMTQ